MNRKKICFALSTLIVSSWAGAEVKFSGFADLQYAGQSEAWDANGIFLNDSALYLSTALEKSEFHLDLPFSSAENGSLNWAQEKLQAYVKYAANESLSFQAGQFDGLFGFEESDSKDLHFSAGGLLYNSLPSSHMGIMASYKLGIVGINLLIANPDDQGMLDGERVDLAAQYRYDLSEEDTFLLGIMLSKAGDERVTLIDATGGFSLSEALRADLELNLVFDRTLPDPTLGYFLNLIYSASKTQDYGLRAEYLFNGRTGEGVFLHSQFLVTVGPKFQINEALDLKAEYSISMNRIGEASDVETKHAVRVSGVYSF